MTKNRQRTKAIFGGLVALTLILGQFAMPASSAGNAPTFNMFTPFVRVQTQGHDYFLINVKNETENSAWTGNVNAKAGDTLLFYLFYHNGENNTTARNTTIKVDLPSSTASTQHTISASLWADNATNATQSNPFRQSVQASLNDSQKLEFVPGSVKWFPDQTNWMTSSPVSIPEGQPETNLFSNGINIGDIEGCWEFSGAVMFKAKVGQQQPNIIRDLSINKTVRNITSGQSGDSDSANAKVNDRLLYKISVFNNGNATLTNVIVRDNLPSPLSIVSGTLKVDNDSNFGNLANGINIGSINIGVSKIVNFEAIVNNPTSFFVPLTLVNTSFAKADNVNEKSDSATVYVSDNIQPNRDLSINKTVRNVTAWQGDYSDSANANSNDRLSYRIQVTNTGNAVLNNVIVRDGLPSPINFISGSIRIDGVQCWDNLSSINLGSLNVGASKTITFEATVDHSGSNSITATNTAFAKADNVNEKSDSASVFISGQVQPNLNLNISKTVRNATSNTSYFSSVNANPNDKVAFRIEINSSGSNQNINNVRVWDNLPSGLNFVSGSARLDNSFLSDQIVSSGTSLGSIGPNQIRVITFKATVGWWGWGNTTLTNTAFVSGDNAPQRSASAQVIVSQTPIPTPTFTPTPTPTFTPAPSPRALTKKVENLTSPNGTDFANTASIGDTLRYRISYINDTNSFINNVQILDVIPSHAGFVSVAENTGSFDSSKNMITWNIGSLAPGATISVSYQAKVASSVPHDEFVIVNTAAIRANEIPFTDSNEVRTTVRIGKIPIKAVTGSNSQTTTLIFALLGTLWALFVAYLAMEYKEQWQDLRLKWAIYRIKRS